MTPVEEACAARARRRKHRQGAQMSDQAKQQAMRQRQYLTEILRTTCKHLHAPEACMWCIREDLDIRPRADEAGNPPECEAGNPQWHKLERLPDGTLEGPDLTGPLVGWEPVAEITDVGGIPRYRDDAPGHVTGVVVTAPPPSGRSPHHL